MRKPCVRAQAAGKKCPKTGVVNLYGCLDVHGFVAIYFVNPCYRIRYFLPSTSSSCSNKSAVVAALSNCESLLSFPSSQMMQALRWI